MKKESVFLEHWIAFVNQDDETAFHSLYSYYFKYLSNVGIRKGFPSERVHDNINDIFLYLWEKRQSLSNVTNFHNYIITSFLRKLYLKESIHIDASIDLSDIPELQTAPSIESQLIINNSKLEASKTIKRIIDKLPTKQKQMIYQKFYLGLSYKEISVSNAVSINTVYNTVYNAIDNLKKEMTNEQWAALALMLSFISIYFAVFF